MIQTAIKSALFSNKINTLLYLKDRLSFSNVLDLFYFSVREFYEDKELIFNQIVELFSDEIIIRSSASTEDQYTTNAGHFLSIQHVNSKNKEQVFSGIKKVINSYENDSLSDSELIFIQKQLKDVILSGVVLSSEPAHGKPYFLVNFDDSGSTDSVTSGKCRRYMYIARDFISQSNSLEAKLCTALIEVEENCENNNLNIEFAITKDSKIYILQVRRLKINSFSGVHEEGLKRKNIFKTNYAQNNYLLSDMAFWNPSEIIGDAPHPLDYSLYNYLITESAWNQGIEKLGYYSTQKMLMTKVGNKPYINLETAFLALTPSAIDGRVRKKLVDYYCRILLKNKKLHDKIEFEIVYNCYDFSTDYKLFQLKEFGFTPDEINSISSSLLMISKSIIEHYNLILREDNKKLDLLEKTLNKCIVQLNENNIQNILENISLLLPVIRECGAVPFARHARCAFIARSICLSLVSTGKISSEELDKFMLSIKTVASELQADVLKYKKAEITKDEMNCKYGHLRSKTYDILSPSYKELGFDKIFDFSKLINKHIIQDDQTINHVFVLEFQDVQIDFADFVKTAIAQREYFKFVFTKALSFVLDMIIKLAQQLKLSREDISFLTIENILSICLTENSREKIVKIINDNKHEFKLNSYIVLPSVISKPEDFDVIRVDEGAPNFITSKVVVGEIYVLDKLTPPNIDITDKIIVLSNADPGFDWIFAQGTIKGLVTQYGGMASHMAIRCMEFGIPAAIGCGELIYNYIVKAQRIKLDCLSKKVVII